MAQRTAQLTGDKSLRKSTVNASITLLDLELAKMLKHSLPLFGTDVMCAFFRNIRTKA